MICVYCKERRGNTKDHPVAKKFFTIEIRRRLEKNFVKVPCCEECQQLKDMDDGFLLHCLALRDDVAELPQSPLKSVVAGLSDKRAIKQLSNLLKRTRETYAKNSNGIILPVTCCSVPPQPLRRAISWIMRGLHWYHYRSFVSKFYVYSMEDLKEIHHTLNISEWGVLGSKLERQSVTGKMDIFGARDVFIYSHQTIDNDPNHGSIWGMEFYGTVFFCGIAFNPMNHHEAQTHATQRS